MKIFIITFITSFITILILQHFNHYDLICWLIAFTIGAIIGKLSEL